MYCITRNDGFKKLYLAYQNTSDKKFYNYYFTDKETFLMNLTQNKKDHPTLFKTPEHAEAFITNYAACSGIHKINFDYEHIDSKLLPTCNMDCFTCNKRHKHTCRHLRNPYQNYCGFCMARFDDDFKPDEKRLDAPCEKCLTKECVYNMNI